MGIRSHKFMGWAYPEYSKEDLLLNHNQIERLLCAHYDYSYTEGFLKAEAELDFSYFCIKNSFCSDSLSDTVLRLEANKVNYLCIRPLFETSWERYGDSLDYTECTVRNYQYIDLVHWLDQNPFPYQTLYRDSETNEILNANKTIETLFYLLAKEPGNSHLISKIVSSVLPNSGIEDVEELRDRIHPAVPDEMIRQVSYMNIFNNVDSIHLLRPVYISTWD